jgi:hypothetical protein
MPARRLQESGAKESGGSKERGKESGTVLPLGEVVMETSGLVQFHPDLTSLLMPIDDIQQYPGNANNGDIDGIAESIQINGMYRPVYVQRSTGYIVAGNSTWEACKTLEATEIPAIFLDIDDTTALRIVLADNRLARNALMDSGDELDLLHALSETDSLLGTGYSPLDMKRLERLTTPPAPVAEDFTTWPVLCVQVPPQTKRAYLEITEAAGGDLERFHLLLRLAGWQG